MSVCSGGHAASLPVQFGFGDSWYHRNKQKHIYTLTFRTQHKKKQRFFFTWKTLNTCVSQENTGFPKSNAHSSVFSNHVAVIEVANRDRIYPS